LETEYFQPDGTEQRAFLPKMPHKIVVLELDDVVERRDPRHPCVFVGIQRVGESSEVAHMKLPEWVRGANSLERQDLAPATLFARKENAQKKKILVVNSLEGRGYTVNQCTTVYSLYVIELEPDPAKDGEATAVYVGETTKTPDERFQEHMSGGILASRHVARRGVCLRPDLAPRQKYHTREASRAAEERLAERLRKRGFAVYGGH
jgi:hypothetical protein